MNESRTIAVLGAGYVGLTSAVLFAHAGYQVRLVEPNPNRLQIIKSGKSFFFEQGIDVLLAEVISSGQLVATDSYAEAIPGSSIVFSCVGTPDNPDGSSNLSYVFAAAEQTAAHADGELIYVQKSTVPVGTGLDVEDLFHGNIRYVSNPEFLREGTAVGDTLYFDRIVAGGHDQSAVNQVLDVYRQLESHRDEIADRAGIERIDLIGQYISTTLNSAELVKVASNAFLALKISFANSIAKLADAAEADINEVMDAVGADKRIGRAFLNAGRGYGGGCFPKDVSGLISSGLAYGVDLEIMQAAQETNSSMPGYIIEKLKRTIGGDLHDKKVAVLGLAFKPGTSDVRKSPGIALANILTSYGAHVTAHDPEAIHEAKSDLVRDIRICDNFEQTIDGVDAIIIATNWTHYTERSIADYTTSGAIFVDATNSFNPEDIKRGGLTYIGVGRT